MSEVAQLPTPCLSSGTGSDHLRFALAKQEYAVSIPLNEICSGLEKKNEYAVSNLLGFD